MRFFPLVLLTLSLLATPAAAQSFSCEMAHTVDEDAVCAHPALRLLDEDMARLMKAVKTRIKALRHSDDEAESRRGHELERRFIDGQTALINHRAECGSDLACIEKVYRARIEALRRFRDVLRGRGKSAGKK